MGRADLSVTITRPVEDVFAVLTDPSKSPKWSASAIRTELITPGPPGVGSRRHAVTKGPFGGTMENVMEVTELEPNRKVALRLISATWGGTGRTWYTFTPVDGHTRVDWTWEIEPAGRWKPLGSRPFMALFGRLFQRDLDNLKVMMESGQL
jgi:uncharacterized protein YndB with AHSA1/START domain